MTGNFIQFTDQNTPRYVDFVDMVRTDNGNIGTNFDYYYNWTSQPDDIVFYPQVDLHSFSVFGQTHPTYDLTGDGLPSYNYPYAYHCHTMRVAVLNTSGHIAWDSDDIYTYQGDSSGNTANQFYSPLTTTGTAFVDL